MSRERQISVPNPIDLTAMNLPEDLASLTIPQCKLLCEAIRKLLIDTVMQTGGHLSSNLGVVELTLALHRNFHSPDDRIVWDVGHQAYVHKILTGRLDAFHTLRQENGLAGFPKPTESPHDTFITGHSSTAVSAACGIADAMRIHKNPHYAIAVVGDGASTGGMFYEGLNNGGKTRNNLIVILNDNNWGISKNVGAIAKYLANIRNSGDYVRTKWAVEQTLNIIPKVGKPIAGMLKRTKDRLKKNLIGSTLFDQLGFVYLGPIDGHDVEALDEVLDAAKQYHCPVLVHVHTIKGKGYAPAEQNPGEYHGVPRIDVESKNPEISTDECYSTVFGKELAAIAAKDKSVCAVTAAMKYGTALQFFAAEHPNRFFDVGIAEQHAVTFCAGMASTGMKPVFAVYSTFLQRGYDQIIHDVAIAKHHVVFAIDRAGIVGEDGETHQGIFDVSMLAAIPHMKVYSPAGYDELRLCLHAALHQDKGPVAVRYPRGQEPPSAAELPVDLRFSHIPGKQMLIITYGRISANALTAKKQLQAQGIDCGLLKLTTIVPLDAELLTIAMQYPNIAFFEESDELGGIGEQFAALLLEAGYHGNYFHNAIHGFVRQASVNRIFEKLGLTADAMVQTIREKLV